MNRIVHQKELCHVLSGINNKHHSLSFDPYLPLKNSQGQLLLTIRLIKNQKVEIYTPRLKMYM
ncbi:hypothetical protein BGP_1498 [Beggiatoa sp. PS]|nr:hypothetical protein BGP_1498 [Beggiatoa sp. PS]